MYSFLRAEPQVAVGADLGPCVHPGLFDDRVEHPAAIADLAVLDEAVGPEPAGLAGGRLTHQVRVWKDDRIDIPRN